MEQKATGEETDKIVVFRLGDEEFGASISQVNRILKPTEITRVPNTPPYILGVLNLRGRIVVVVDLAQKLGFTSKPFDAHTRIINVEIGDTILGMVVESAKDLLTINKASIKPAPALIQKKIDAEYLQGVAILDQRVIILLNLTKVLDLSMVTSLSEDAAQAASEEKDETA